MRRVLICDRGKDGLIASVDDFIISAGKITRDNQDKLINLRNMFVKLLVEFINKQKEIENEK